MAPDPLNLSESLSTETLILRLRSTEHDFVERKSRSDKGDWLQTAVAFANSAPIGYPAVLFVGVDDNGNPQQRGTEKLEDLAKSVSGIIDQAYPAIYRHIVPLHLPDGHCLAVVIPGSEARPHFAGISYIRDGPQNKRASAEQFDAIVADRLSLSREIRKYIGQKVFFDLRTAYPGEDYRYTSTVANVVDCNAFYVTLDVSETSMRLKAGRMSFSIGAISLTYDYSNDRLFIHVYQK